jgi:hypothetical protein
MSILVPISENIWVLEGDNVDFHGFAYPTRSVIIRLQNGGLWVWSPIKLSEQLRSECGTIGRPAHLVSPNKLHHLFLSDWHAAFPEAKLWGPASTIRKRRDLPFQPPLIDNPPAAWVGQIDQCWFRGSLMMDEIGFFHPPSRTAILADLCQNFSSKWLRENWAPWQRPVAHFSKMVESKGYAPIDWRLSFVRREKLRKAREKVLGWDPRTVIMAHGEWQAQNGGQFLARAFEWIG